MSQKHFQTVYSFSYVQVLSVSKKDPIQTCTICISSGLGNNIHIIFIKEMNSYSDRFIYPNQKTPISSRIWSSEYRGQRHIFHNFYETLRFYSVKCFLKRVKMLFVLVIKAQLFLREKLIKLRVVYKQSKFSFDDKPSSVSKGVLFKKPYCPAFIAKNSFQNCILETRKTSANVLMSNPVQSTCKSIIWIKTFSQWHSHFRKGYHNLLTKPGTWERVFYISTEVDFKCDVNALLINLIWS